MSFLINSELEEKLREETNRRIQTERQLREQIEALRRELDDSKRNRQAAAPEPDLRRVKLKPSKKFMY